MTDPGHPAGRAAGFAPAWTAPSRSSSARWKFGAPIYVRHEIVHNTYVVNDLKAKGRHLHRGPGRGARRRHAGLQRPRREPGGARRGRARGFQVFDATCPLVTKVHVEVAKLHREGYEFIMIGHKGHPEVEGTMGQLVTTASTWSRTSPTSPAARSPPAQARRGHADHAVGRRRAPSWPPSSAALPAGARAQAAGHLLRHAEPPGCRQSCWRRRWTWSSWWAAHQLNSNRLRELAERLGTPAYMVDSRRRPQRHGGFDGRPCRPDGRASAPDVLVQP